MTKFMMAQAFQNVVITTTALGKPKKNSGY